jgi:hypothetical protein
VRKFTNRDNPMYLEKNLPRFTYFTKHSTWLSSDRAGSFGYFVVCGTGVDGRYIAYFWSNTLSPSSVTKWAELSQFTANRSVGCVTVVVLPCALNYVRNRLLTQTERSLNQLPSTLNMYTYEARSSELALFVRRGPNWTDKTDTQCFFYTSATFM